MNSIGTAAEISSINDSAGIYISRIQQALQDVNKEEINVILETLILARQRGSNVFIFGNGGSAATALHMATDFAKTVEKSNIHIKATCLNSNISAITAIANDHGYENSFSEQLEPLVAPNDVVVGISASGNSPNCVKAFLLAKKRKAITIGLLGFSGGRMKEIADYVFHVKVNNYFIAEDLHMIASHSLTAGLRGA